MKQSMIVVAAVVIGLVTAGTTVVGAASTGGIGGRPANPDKDNPRSQSIFINTVDHGGSVKDTVLIANNSDETRTIELYAVDGLVTNTGAYTCRQKSESLTASGAWIKLSKDTVKLKSGDEQEVPFTINVPKNADVGEHNACLVFADKEEKGEAQGNLRIHTRQAVRVVTTIPGDLHRKITLESFHAQGNTRTPQFSLRLYNKGNVSADVDAQVSLKSLFGKTSFKNGGVYPVLPNEKLELTFVNEDAPAWGGWYKAQLKVDYNTNAKALGFDPEADKAETLTDEQTIFILPSTMVLSAIIGAILLVVAYVVYRTSASKSQRQREQTWKAYAVKDGDTLESLALKSGVTWQQLAKTNKLSAPYTLKTGQKIKLPQAVKATSGTGKKPKTNVK